MAFDVISFKKADNVQKQLNQALADGDQLAETQVARVGADGTAYQTLKERLDAEHAEIATTAQSLQAEIAQATATLKEQESQTETLTRGLNVINSDQSSPLKVEFYGNTLVNLLGKDGFNQIVFSSGKDHFIKIADTNLSAGNYLLVYRVDETNQADYNSPYYSKGDGSTPYQSFSSTHNNTTGFKYWKINAIDGIKSLHYRVRNPIADVKVSRFAIYQISSDTYNKIGVSLTDADVERLFPYVDSVQHVQNPVVTVEGANLLPPFTEWDLGSDVDLTNSYEIKTDGASSNVKVKVFPNQPYYLTVESNANRFAVFENGNQSLGNYVNGGTFTPTTDEVEIRAYHSSIVNGLYFKNPMLNLGSEPKPFVEHTTKYLYAETTLAGNDNKKDILYRNESLNPPRWEKRKWFENVVLDGSLNWRLSSTVYTGYRRVYLPITTPSLNSFPSVVKFDGKILNDGSGSTGNNWTTPDSTNISSTGDLFITISNSDSGWTDAMSITNDQLKSYFYGWKYTGDGTTHSWVSLVDGSAPAENTLAYVSTNQAPNFTPYKLTYQLAKPVIEVEGEHFPKVEGDLSISGNAQVTVGSEFTYTEDEEGKRTYTITPSNQRTGANLTEVKATYQQSIKSSFQQVVAKQSDIATEVSIQARSIIDLYAKLKAMEV